MARGRRSGDVDLYEIPDEQVIKTDIIKNAPNYVFPDGLYGIQGNLKDYALVKSRVSRKLGKEEDGELDSKVFEYTVWEDVPSYQPTIEGIFEAYAKILKLSEFKAKKLRTDIAEIIEIHKNTDAKINEALKGFGTHLNIAQQEVCELVDVKNVLLEEIDYLKGTIDEFKKKAKEFDANCSIIKEKTTIIVNRDKPKNHRIKKED